MEYATPSEVVKIRVLHERHIGSGGDWGLDGLDDQGRFTDDCWSFASEEEAYAAIPEFCRANGIPQEIAQVRVAFVDN